MSFEDLVPYVRRVLGDLSQVSPVHSDDEILYALVDGVERLHAVRPESRYNGGVIDDLVYPSTTAALKVLDTGVAPRWFLGVIYYAAGRVYEQDSTDTVNMQLSADYFKKADAVFAQ